MASSLYAINQSPEEVLLTQVDSWGYLRFATFHALGVLVQPPLSLSAMFTLPSYETCSDSKMWKQACDLLYPCYATWLPWLSELHMRGYHRSKAKNQKLLVKSLLIYLFFMHTVPQLYITYMLLTTNFLFISFWP